MLNLVKESVRLANVNTRTEKHGDEDVLACDLQLEAKLHNSVLLKFSPTLRDAFYMKDPGAVEDMINPDHAPKLRFPEISSIKWNLEMKNVRFSVFEDGTNEEEIIFAEAKAKKFTFVFQEGGTVVVGLCVQVSDPAPEDVTKLLMLLNKQLKVNLEQVDPQPEEEQQAGASSEEPRASDLLTGAADSLGDQTSGSDSDDEEFDELFDKAKAFVNGSSRTSIKALMRDMKVSTLTATKILDQMQVEGIVGAAAGNGVRQVLAPALSTATH